MKKHIVISAATLLAAAMVLLAGCASIPKVSDPSGVEISVTRMSDSQVRTRFGTGAAGDLNPFVPFGGLLTPQTADYVVLDVTIRAARKANLTFYRASAVDNTGKVVGDLYRWEQFKKLIKDWADPGKDYNQLYDRAMRVYFP
ncbi:MAG TPA: hypothetical protein VMW87_01280, partial [Spirochaetia bacterium]|nr:hypothetical protein [Spirochaetia bacterium]